MIYKFKFEIYNDDNEFISGWTEESGDIKKAFTSFVKRFLDRFMVFGV